MNALLKIAVAVFAVALIVAGAVLTISPIPGGILIVGVGVILLAVVMPSVVRGLRRRWKPFDRMMHRIEKILPAWLARRLKASDYEHGAEEVDDNAAPQEKSRSDRG